MEAGNNLRQRRSASEYAAVRHDTFADLFTDRQLVALTTFSDLVSEARERIRLDAVAAGLPDDGVPLREGGTGATAYAEAVGVYLAFANSRQMRTVGLPFARWHQLRRIVRSFRQTGHSNDVGLRGGNPFGNSTGNWMAQVDWVVKSIQTLPAVKQSGMVNKLMPL